MTAADRPSVTDNARAEAERNLAEIASDADLTFGWEAGYKAGFREGAEWAAGRAETVGNDGLTDAEREECARQYRTGPAFQSVRTPLDGAGRAETTTATDEDGPPGEVLIDDTDWVPWRDLPRYAAKQKRAAEDAQREAKMHYLAREELEGLLATARTHPTEGEATDLDRLYSTLNLQGIWVLIDEVAGAVCPWCGDPWESEPSCEHAEAIYQHDTRVMAFALEQAADALLEDPSAERGSVKQRYNAVYTAWLRERAARLRGGAS